MSIDIQIKKGDTRDWVFTLSDATGTALNLTSATVLFRLKSEEGDDNIFFDRGSGAAGPSSDYISIGTPASDAEVTITPTASDWTAFSDYYGVYVGSFRIEDSNGDIQYTKDVTVDVQEALI